MSSERRCDPKAWLEALEEKNWKCNPRDEEEAYSVQTKVMETAKEAWGEVLGWKAALTGKSTQELFGGGPIYGPLFEKGFLGTESKVNLNKLSDPLLEPEIMWCEDSWFLAFEIPDNRYGRAWRDLNYLQLIADLAGSYKVVVGREEISELKGDVVLTTPSGEVRSEVNRTKVLSSLEFLRGKGLSGCLLLGTLLPPLKPEEGTYVLECCGARVSVTLIR
jgi:2-keto-4-pentenoate hydratase